MQKEYVLYAPENDEKMDNPYGKHPGFQSLWVGTSSRVGA